MPGTNAGTGWPICFFCVKCRRKRLHRQGDVIRTGKTRPYHGGNRGARGLDTFHQYQCKRCGHIGWSRHIDIVRKPLEVVLTPDGTQQGELTWKTERTRARSAPRRQPRSTTPRRPT